MEDTMNLLINLVKKYQQNVEKELIDRWNLWPISIDEQKLFQVVGGLLCRHLVLTVTYLDNTSNWNRQISSFYLRILGENYINLAWILKENVGERVNNFIATGLGQEKLIREKLKQKLIDIKEYEQLQEAFKEREEFFNQFSYAHHTDIIFTSWAGSKDLRGRCEEVGEKEFYDFCIMPSNDILHGSYNVLIETYLRVSDNPLHKNMMVPNIRKFVPDIDSPLQVVRLLDKAFNCTDEYFNITPTWNSSYVVFTEGINEISNHGKSS